VIGVYEPVVVRAGDVSRESSLGADPLLATAMGAALYRRDCHTVRDSPNPAASD
jgi:hypothetical protein